MSSPTGRLVASQPEIQNLSPYQWEILDGIIKQRADLVTRHNALMFSTYRTTGKSWIGDAYFEMLRQRQEGQAAIKRACVEFIASYKK